MFCFTELFLEHLQIFSNLVSNNVLKDLYMYIIVKYANILKYENSVNRTVVSKKKDYLQIHKTIKQTSQKNNFMEHDTTL